MLCKVGSGTYGSVYKYTGAPLAAPMAVKRIPHWRRGMMPTVQQQDAADLATAWHDAVHETTALWLLSRLDAPCFLRYYGAFAVPAAQGGGDIEEVLVAMELATGGCLYKLQPRPVAPATLREWMFLLLWSLMVMQMTLRVRHGDISAGNIMLTRAPPDAVGSQRHFTLRHRARRRAKGDSGTEEEEVETTMAWEQAWTLPPPNGDGGAIATPVFIDMGFVACTAVPRVGRDYRDMATLPSPDLLLAPDGALRSWASDTWALGVVYMGLLLGEHTWPHGDPAFAQRTAVPPALRVLLPPDNDTYWFAMIALQQALGNGALAAAVSLVQAAIDPHVTRLRARLEDVERRHGAAALDLARVLLAWQPDPHPAYTALCHAAFADFCCGSAAGVVDVDAPHQWYSANYHALTPSGDGADDVSADGGGKPVYDRWKRRERLVVQMLADNVVRTEQDVPLFLDRMSGETKRASAGIPLREFLECHETLLLDV